MDVCVGRQPIFDRKMGIYGYELLYRQSSNNFFEGTEDNQATAELINNAYFTMQFHELTNGTKAFINFSKELIEREIPLLLPKESIVVEIIERGVPTSAFMNACRKLKSAGYALALDNFTFHETFLPLIEIADIIKVEFSSMPHLHHQGLIKKYKKVFLAQKIETHEDYHKALEMGYSLFQGYFFQKPTIVTGKAIEVLNTNLVRVLHELNQAEPEFKRIANIIEGDLGLSYKLLKLSNSLLFGSVNKIGSINQALVRLGMKELKKWIYIMMLKESQHVENRELIKTSLIRAKLMELIAIEIGIKTRVLEFFLTGMLSSMDVLLHRSLTDILTELPLTPDIKGALLGENNGIRQALNKILLFETADWDKINESELFDTIHKERFMAIYIESLKWTMELDY